MLENNWCVGDGGAKRVCIIASVAFVRRTDETGGSKEQDTNRKMELLKVVYLLLRRKMKRWMDKT